MVLFIFNGSPCATRFRVTSSTWSTSALGRLVHGPISEDSVPWVDHNLIASTTAQGMHTCAETNFINFCVCVWNCVLFKIFTFTNATTTGHLSGRTWHVGVLLSMGITVCGALIRGGGGGGVITILYVYTCIYNVYICIYKPPYTIF